MKKNNIKTIREKLGISAADLAKLSGVTAAYISQLENGKKDNPSSKTLEKIAKALNVKVSALTDIEDTIENINEFTNANDALKFILEQPVVATAIDFNPSELSDEDKISFANDLLEQMKLIKYKYIKKR